MWRDLWDKARGDICMFRGNSFSKSKLGPALGSVFKIFGIYARGTSALAFVKKLYHSSLRQSSAKCSLHFIQAPRGSSLIWTCLSWWRISWRVSFFVLRRFARRPYVSISLRRLPIFWEGAYLGDFTLYLQPCARRSFISHIRESGPWCWCPARLTSPDVPRSESLRGLCHPSICCCSWDAVPQTTLRPAHFSRVT